MKTTKEQREELKQHMEWMARRYDRHTANKYFLAMIDDLESAESRIAELEAENARLREATQWRPIETAPKDGTAVIVAAVLGNKVTSVRMCTWNGLGWYEVYSGAGINFVTLWMPLPSVTPQESECK